MKETTTAHSFSTAKRTAGRMTFVVLLTAFFSTAAFSQTFSPGQEIGDLSGKEWKPVANLGQTIASERAKMDVMLTAPDLPEADRALFLSYQWLLDLLLADVQAGNPVNESLVRNYEKVVEGAQYNPDLKNLPANGLSTLLPGLLEALTAVPEPAVLDQW